MVNLSPEELAALKGEGFLLMKDKEQFVLRIIFPAGLATAEDLRNVAMLAEKYGKGIGAVTVRLNIEIVGIPYENIAPMKEEMDKLGIVYGGTGARVRPLVCCKGTVCKFGLVGTQAICKELHNKFYPMDLPHKFKINVTGCPNNCAKVQLNDLGFMGAPKGRLRVFIGGRFGRESMIGEEICRIEADKAVEVTTICTDFFKAHGKPKQRFGNLLEEMKNTQEYTDFIASIKALAAV